MKKLTLILILAAMSLASSAQLDGTGFYRVKNYYSSRYLHIVDNRGSVNMVAQTADMGAVLPLMGDDKVKCRANSVIFFKSLGGNKWDLQAQGTSTYNLTGYPVLVVPHMLDSDGTYQCYASDHGTTLYLADVDDFLEYEDGNLAAKGAAKRNEVLYKQEKWWVKPITEDGEEWLGIQPTVTVGDRHYATYYASFAFRTVSPGMRVYKVTERQTDIAALDELTGVIPAATPVVIECASADPSANRIMPVASSAAAPTANLLRGVYFRYMEDRPNHNHHNITAYKAATMRVLGKTADGRLAFVTGADTCVDANTAYLPVTGDAQSQLLLLGRQDYDDIVPVTAVKADDTGTADVYNAQGLLVRRSSGTLVGLPAGLYIVGGRKVVLP